MASPSSWSVIVAATVILSFRFIMAFFFIFGFSAEYKNYNDYSDYNDYQCIQIIEAPYAQCTLCKASVLGTFLVTRCLWDWTNDFGAVGHPFYQCAMQSSLKVCWKGWGQSAKLGTHSAIWGKLGTALQAYTLNPSAKFPPNPTSRKVNT